MAEPADKRDPVVVGIGASAGGLNALHELFRSVPEGSGCAFVVVVHLAPDHESHLAELLQPSVRFPVEQVSDTIALEADHVYVIPPNRNLNTIDTHLRLTPLERERRQRAPVDHFFRTLAKTHDSEAIAIVLTGTGSDGALGIKEIKERGGLTIVQDPADAEFDGMPHSAISTGMVDLVLPLAEIPEVVLKVAAHEPEVPIPSDDGDLDADDAQTLKRVCAQIRARTGRDFSQYKRSTIMRRIKRRMQLRQLARFPEYLAVLQEDPDEVRLLADDMLITVSSFFRDEDVFEQLATHAVPAIFDGKTSHDTVRVWSVGCATGEEAYSLAILLLEEAGRRTDPPPIQVFASDLHEGSLGRARDGFYPGDIETDVSPERLQQFFQRDDGGYRIRDELRELMVFAPHDLMRDPPFSRIDLIACRNLLIYLERGVQQDVMQIFHYALRPDGWLALGTSESMDAADLFRTEDRSRCIFRKRNVPAPSPRLPAVPPTRTRIGAPRPVLESAPAVLEYDAVHQQLLEAYAPPSLLIGPDDRVVHLSDDVGRYLQHPGGEPTANVLRLVRDELVLELRATLHRVRESGRPWASQTIPTSVGGDVVIHAVPGDDGFVLVVIRAAVDGPEPPPVDPDAPGSTQEDRTMQVASERDLARQRLQVIIEQYETGQEELKASNEELQSSNEELRSTLEELETSKEELQTMNEELQTVNEENRHKVEELAQLSSDLQNLLAATEIATIFLDRELRIMRFTPTSSDLFNVRGNDRGRPLADLTHRLGYPELTDDARQVLRHLAPVQREVVDEGGRWYLVRVLAYRSHEDRIEGVVLTFVDISDMKAAEAALRRSEQALAEANETLEQRVEERTRQVRELASTLSMAEQEARRRIGQVLHDDLQQQLYGIQMKLDVVRQDLDIGDAEHASSTLSDAEERLLAAIEITRNLTVDLAPPLLEDDGLPEAFAWLVSYMRDMHGLEVDVSANTPDVADQNRRQLLFQVARELLFNVAKHAGVDRANVTIDGGPEVVVLAISDDGQGFDPQAIEEASARPGLGLFSVRERVRLLGGDVVVDAHPGEGTSITVHLPLDRTDGAS